MTLRIVLKDYREGAPPPLCLVVRLILEFAHLPLEQFSISIAPLKLLRDTLYVSLSSLIQLLLFLRLQQSQLPYVLLKLFPEALLHIIVLP